MTQHHRRSIRLKDYDYSQAGAYFVTICTHQRLPLFGRVVDGEMVLSGMGVIAETEWLQTAALRPYIELDAYVVMPNHMHGIMVIHDAVGGRGLASQTPTARQTPAPRQTPAQFAKPIAGALGTIVGAYKSSVTRQINRLPNPLGAPVRQRNYHEHIIRHETALDRIRAYIAHNPARWTDDVLFGAS